ncbi:regucalcin-like [Agrilus planipennis]|uniref:Regucalcin n=1 Tax=Agrilus planipennis TaxID=224129 RepID=A0A1W4WH85_AGRPL|nr:regucalcin-like [Agrilus planipennis]
MACSVFLSSLLLLLLPLSNGYVAYSNKNIKIYRVTGPIDHGEAPHWDPKRQALYFVDAFNTGIYRLKDGIVTTQTIGNADFVGTVTPVADTKSKFLITSDTNAWIMDWDGSANNSAVINYRRPFINDLEPTKPNNQINDGKADTHGQFWLGTLTRNADDTVTTTGGSLYMLRCDGTAKKLFENTTISNGLDWNSHDTKFYFIDSTNRTVTVFDYNREDGTLSNWKELFKLSDYPSYASDVIPDGMAADSNDNLWVALYRGGAVINVDSQTGNLIRVIKMPVSHVTSVAFGGKNLDILYVTTSRHGFNESMLNQQPSAGSTFAIEGLGVTGNNMNDYRYQGNIQQFF